MPGYNTHRLFNYLVFFIITLFMFYEKFFMLDLSKVITLILGFYIGTEFITPDLDTNSTAYKKWGKLRFLILPYKWLFKHRGSSHSIILGALVRILYITFLLLVSYFFIFKSFPLEMTFYFEYILIFIIGVACANALHVILDEIL